MKKKQKVVRIHPRNLTLQCPFVLTVDETLLYGQPSMCMVMIR